MRLHRHLFPFIAVLFLAEPLLSMACKKDEPPPPANLPSDEDDKPKKKKKKGDDDDNTDPKPIGDDDTAGSSSVKIPTGSGSASKKASDKALLQACCTALHVAAQNAGAAEAA